MSKISFGYPNIIRLSSSKVLGAGAFKYRNSIVFYPSASMAPEGYCYHSCPEEEEEVGVEGVKWFW